MARHPLSSKVGAPQPGAPRSPVGRKGPLDPDLSGLVRELTNLDLRQLALRWRNHLGGSPPAHLPRWLLVRLLAYRIQAAAYGDLDRALLRGVRHATTRDQAIFVRRRPTTKEGVELKAGAILVREWKGSLERVMVVDQGFAWNGATYSSLSMVARAITGTNWNGHRFFGLRKSHAV